MASLQGPDKAQCIKQQEQQQQQHNKNSNQQQQRRRQHNANKMDGSTITYWLIILTVKKSVLFTEW